MESGSFVNEMDLVEIAGCTDTGKVRKNNEDTIAFDATGGVAVLADGMGGLARGEVASRLTVTSLIEFLSAAEVRDDASVIAAIEHANGRVRERASSNAEMGTTVVVWVLAGEGQCFVGHVGDSRAYRLRGDQLTQLTLDHSLVQQMVDEGIISPSEARHAPNRNVITRAVGLDSHVQVDVRSWVCVHGDVFLLCSDGLTDLLSEEEISAVLDAHLISGTSDLGDTARALVAAANESGGFDNISVILIRARRAQA